MVPGPRWYSSRPVRKQLYGRLRGANTAMPYMYSTHRCTRTQVRAGETLWTACESSRGLTARDFFVPGALAMADSHAVPLVVCEDGRSAAPALVRPLPRHSHFLCNSRCVCQPNIYIYMMHSRKAVRPRGGSERNMLQNKTPTRNFVGDKSSQKLRVKKKAYVVLLKRQAL